MTTSVVYRWVTIGAGQSANVFIHDYTDRESVFYSVVLYNQPASGVLFPEAHATVTQGETFRWHVNGTIGRKVYVTNQDHISSVGVDLLETKESY
jgi:hypothetical protein